jgi:hypothetical protein
MPGDFARVFSTLRAVLAGQACFNFKSDPDAAVLAELKRLTGAAQKQWSGQNWL